MSLTKATYSMIQGAPVNVLDFGASPSATGAENYAAFTAALNKGKSVFVPAGTYEITGSLVMPQGVMMFGEDLYKSILQIGTTASTAAIEFGNTSVNLTYGGGLFNLQIALAVNATIGVRLRGTTQTSCQNILIGTTNAVGLNNSLTGIVIDGCNASSFYNQFTNIDCNHVNIGYKFFNTGNIDTAQNNLVGAHGTTNTFINCNVFGDKVYGNTDSTGFQFNQREGQDSVFINCNCESLGRAITFTYQFAGLSVDYCRTIGTKCYGVRFEDNTIDIDFGAQSSTGFGGFKNTFITDNYVLSTAKIDYYVPSHENLIIASNEVLTLFKIKRSLELSGVTLIQGATAIDAADGDVVLANNKSLRGAFADNSASRTLVKLNASNKVELGNASCSASITSIDITGGAGQTITAGIADSGGVGFRLLRISN